MVNTGEIGRQPLTLPSIFFLFQQRQLMKYHCEGKEFDT